MHLFLGRSRGLPNYLSAYWNLENSSYIQLALTLLRSWTCSNRSFSLKLFWLLGSGLELSFAPSLALHPLRIIHVSLFTGQTQNQLTYSVITSSIVTPKKCDEALYVERAKKWIERLEKLVGLKQACENLTCFVTINS